MKKNRISILALCLSAIAMTAKAQNVTVQKQGGIGHVYELEQVDSVVYYPIGETELFPTPEAENTTTLWSVIKAQPNLKKFAAILEAASYYSEEHKPTDRNFSHVIDGSVPMNIYAPSDDAISDDLYAELLGQVQTDGWKLQQKFIAAHISPQEAPSTENGVTMLNGKQIRTDGINVLSVNTDAACGKLCIISEVLPYLPNMTEYLMELAPGCSLAREFIANADTTYFDYSRSVTFPTLDGNMLMLDSINTTDNKMMRPLFSDEYPMRIQGFGTDLANEIANYSMLVPTDEVWNDALAKLSKNYRYASVYEDKIKGDMGNKTKITGINPDSIAALSMGADILVSLLGRTTEGQQIKLSNGTAYMASEWTVPTSEYKPDVEVELEYDALDTLALHVIMLDSLRNDYYPWYSGDTYSEKYGMYYDSDRYLFNEEDKYYYLNRDYVPVDAIFNEDGTIKDLIYDWKTDTIPLTPIVVPEIEQKTSFVYNKNGQGSQARLGTYSRCMPFDNERYAEIANRYGRVSNNNFYYFTGRDGMSGPKVEIKLQGKKGEQVMSGKYDIQIVMVPHWYCDLSHDTGYTVRDPSERYIFSVDSPIDIPAEWRDPDSGQISEAVIDSLANRSKQKFSVSLTYNNNGSEKIRTSLARSIAYDGLRVDTITVAEDFEFPTSYKNVHASYPVLYIECVTSKSDRKNGFIYNLCIDKIILRSKKDGTETEVTP